MVVVNQILKNILISFIINFIILSIFFFSVFSINLGYPNIKLNNGILETKELKNGYIWKTTGFFNPITNTIFININKSNDEITRILFHEYGHYIYNNLKSKDKKIWEENFCTNQEKIGYYPFQVCEEEFAEGFSNYLNHKMDTIKKWDYFKNITEKYI